MPVLAFEDFIMFNNVEVDFDTFIREIAEGLGFDSRKIENVVYFSDNQGREIVLLPLFPLDKISITGHYKDEDGKAISPCEYGFHTPQITISVKKTTKAIVKEIQKRFLEKYTETFQSVRLEIKRKKSLEQNAEDLLNEIAKILDIDPFISENGIFKTLSIDGGNFKTFDGERVRLELYAIPREKILRIAEILKEASVQT